jgi:hypothetical protein
LKFKTIIVVLSSLCLASEAQAILNNLPGSDNTPFIQPRDRKGPKLDRNALREQVDETQALLDALARESRGLKAVQTDPLFTSLRDEYHLGGYVGKARKALAQAEEVLEVQEAVKLQEEASKKAAVSDQAAEDSKLLGLKSDLVGVVDGLRDTLREIHNNATEDTARDFRNWIMVSEGLLRNRREEAAANPVSATAAADNVSVSAEAPLTYEGLSPTAAGATAVSQTPAVALNVSAPAEAVAAPARKKKGQR